MTVCSNTVDGSQLKQSDVLKDTSIVAWVDILAVFYF